MDIEGAGPALIEQLLENKLIKNYGDLYLLQEKRAHLANLDFKTTFGETNADQLIRNVEESSKIRLDSVIDAMRLPSLNEAVKQSLTAKYHSLLSFANASRQELGRIRGLSSAGVNGIDEFFRPSDRSRLIKTLTLLCGKNVLNIRGLGKVRITRLVETGIIDQSADLYELREKRTELINLRFTTKFGKKNAETLLRSIEESKSLPFSRLLSSLSIQHVGSTAAELLAEHLGDMDSLGKASEDDLLGINGVGPELASSIRGFFDSVQGQETIQVLKEVGVNMRQPEDEGRSYQPLAGKTVVITGTFDNFARKEIENLIRKLGGKSTGSVSRKTHLVVYGSSPGSKLKRAKALGVEVIDELEFLKRIGSE